MTQTPQKQKLPARKKVSQDLLEELHLLAALAGRQDDDAPAARQPQ